MKDNKAPRVLVEKYIKSKGGKVYCNVNIFIGSTIITVGEFCTDSDEIAKTKAKKAIEETLKESNYCVEKYVKSKGGEVYCDVFHFVGRIMVEVGEFCTDNYELANAKAKKALEEALNAF